MSFLMIDIDKFKPYNDQFGHAEGDKALQLTAQSLKATLRGADVAARYGGEEFSILLPQTTLREALLIAERVRQKVEETEFPNRKVTVSIGVSSCSPECTTTGLMSEADQALYAAKRRGGNNVQVFGDLKLDKSNDE
jgi:diguanylate cyclase (GGDEF)-like protein